MQLRWPSNRSSREGSGTPSADAIVASCKSAQGGQKYRLHNCGYRPSTGVKACACSRTGTGSGTIGRLRLLRIAADGAACMGDVVPGMRARCWRRCDNE